MIILSLNLILGLLFHLLAVYICVCLFENYALMIHASMCVCVCFFSHQVGCDRSSALVQICEDRGFQAFVSDALSLPLRSVSFDACISIAVIHHFSTQVQRILARGHHHVFSCFFSCYYKVDIIS